MTLFIGLRIYGKENLPRSHPFIIVANHSSHLDTVALMSMFPFNMLNQIRPIAAADYFEKNAIASWLSHTFFNTLCIERNRNERKCDPMASMKEAVSKKQSLILFPEGTRALSNEIGPFHYGVACLATEFLEIPIVPVYLLDLGRALPKGEFWPIPFFCEVRIGKPMYPNGSKDEILDQLRQVIMELRVAPRPKNETSA